MFNIYLFLKQSSILAGWDDWLWKLEFVSTILNLPLICTEVGFQSRLWFAIYTITNMKI